MKKKIFNKRMLINVFPQLFFFYDKLKTNYNNKRNYTLIRIPKTATTKLHQLIKEVEILSNLIDLPHHNIRIYHLQKNDKFILPLRNPIQRMQSAFYYEVQKIDGSDFFILEFLFTKIKDFNNFCEWLYSFNPFKYLSSRLYFYTGYHMQDTLYSYFISKTSREPFHIIEQEEFEKDFLDLCNKLKVKNSLVNELKIKNPINFGNYKEKGLSKLALKNINRFLSKDMSIYNSLLSKKKKINSI